MLRNFKKRKLNPADLTWEQRNPTDYIYQPSGDVKWLHKTTKRGGESRSGDRINRVKRENRGK